MNSDQNVEVTIEATVTRVDGTVESMGVIASTEDGTVTAQFRAVAVADITRWATAPTIAAATVRAHLSGETTSAISETLRASDRHTFESRRDQLLRDDEELLTLIGASR